MFWFWLLIAFKWALLTFLWVTGPTQPKILYKFEKRVKR